MERARARYPDRQVVQRAIAVSTGRRLDVVRAFTSDRGYPDLSSLVVSRGSGECGVGFTRSFDPVAVREAVYAFDWSDVATDFEGFAKVTEKGATPRKSVSEPVALKMMSDYYQANRNTLPAQIRAHRDLIVELIRDGLPPEDAFAEALSTAT